MPDQPAEQPRKGRGGSAPGEPVPGSPGGGSAACWPGFADDEPEEEWPDPLAGPPDGDDAWLADLTVPQLDALAEELAVARPAAARESVGAGFSHRASAAGIAAGERGWQPDYAAPRATGPASGFAAGGPLDVAAPEPVLAALAQDVIDGGLAGVSDDELIGLLGAARRMASWQAATELTVIAELAARRGRDATAARAARDRSRGRAAAVPVPATAPGDQVPATAPRHPVPGTAPGDPADPVPAAGPGGPADPSRGLGGSSAVGEHVAAEVAAALTLTGRAADGLLGLALEVTRLGPVMTALRAGQIDLAKARVFAAELAQLGDVTACRIATLHLDRAAGWTTSQLRRALRAAVLAADPAAGKRRSDNARQDSRVEAWQEGSGNAALAGRELPAADAIAADARIGRIARALKAAGAAGTLDQLRSGVYLALLLGRDPLGLAPDAPAGQPARRPDPAAQAADLGGEIHLTLPAQTWLGFADRPGELAGLGPIDPYTARDLAALLGGAGTARWHVTLTNPAGQAVAHACPRGQPPAQRDPPPGPAGKTGPPRSTGPPAGPGSRAAWLAGLSFDWLERDPCSHSRHTRAYQPGKALRHLLAIRNPVCTAPGCRRPARHCDNEHTTPYDQGGKTCECNCGPVCRFHHRIKQAPGWRVTQPHPGVLDWTTPSGRTYRTHPVPYPI